MITNFSLLFAYLFIYFRTSTERANDLRFPFAAWFRRSSSQWYKKWREPVSCVLMRSMAYIPHLMSHPSSGKITDVCFHLHHTFCFIFVSWRRWRTFQKCILDLWLAIMCIMKSNLYFPPFFNFVWRKHFSTIIREILINISNYFL